VSRLYTKGFALLGLFCCVLASADVGAAENCSKKICTSDELIQVFDHGIQLNENFKASVNGSDKAKYQDLRVQTEKFDETQMQPGEEQAAKILSTKSDSKLAHSLLTVIVSYENSADETLSDLLGTVFGKNPTVIEQAIKGFSDADRKIILNLLEFGWANVKTDFGPKTVADRDKRLRRLTN
jgi:hypothetical protein